MTPGPPGSSHDIRVGDTVTVDLSGSGQQQVFRLQPDSLMYLTVYFQAMTGAVTVEVRDSARLGPLAVTGATADALLGLLDTRTPVFAVQARQVYHIVVDQPIIEWRGRTRLLVHQVRRAPEMVAARIALGDTVAGESLDPSADVDDFIFAAEAGQEVIAFLQAPAGFRLNGLLAGVYPDAGLPAGRTALGFVQNGLSSTELEASASGRFTIPSAGDHYLTVLVPEAPSAPASAHTGAYRVAVVPVNRAPERVAAALVAGDTLSGEAIDHVGDVDEYALMLPAGTEVNLLFQSTGQPATGLRAELSNAGSGLREALSGAGDTGLSRQATGTAVVPASGSLAVRVEGRSDRALDRGPYRMFPFVVNRAPETAGAALVPGDSVTTEAIELPGDVDEYWLTVPVPVLLNIWLTGLVPPAADFGAGAARLEMEDASGTLLRTVSVAETASPAAGAGSGVAPVAPGTYRLRVSGATSAGQGFRGPYALFTGAVDSAPEGVPPTLAVGDPVTEALEPLGDSDLYQFAGTRGQVLRAAFTDPGVATVRGVQAIVSDSAGWPPLGISYSGQAEPPLNAAPSARMILPRDGTYRVLVRPMQGGGNVFERGPYRFAVTELPTAPEVARAALVPGDSIGNERLDDPSDVDDYLLAAPPGRELQTFIYGYPGPTTVEVLDVTTYDVLRFTQTFGWPQATGLVPIPAGGTVRIRVYAPGRPGCLDASCETAGSGPYDLWVYTISRAPEQGPALIAVGDTVGENVDPVGDIDEFEFDAQAGDTVEVLFQTPGGFGYPPARLELVDQLTDAVLGSVTSMNPTPSLEDQTTGPVVLSRSDRYRIRVASERDTENTGAYRFRVRRLGG